MTKRFQILLFSLLFGFCLNTFFGYAVNLMPSKIVKMSCCKTKNIKTEKSCCQKDKSKKQEKNCGGKCSNSCVTNNLQPFSVINTSFLLDLKFDYCNQKPSFYYKKTFVLSGFNFVWLPPKIA